LAGGDAVWKTGGEILNFDDLVTMQLIIFNPGGEILNF